MTKSSLKDILSAVHARNVFNMLGKSVIVVRENGVESVYLLKEISGSCETAWLQAEPIGVDGVDFTRIYSRLEVQRLDMLMLGVSQDGMDLIKRFDNNEALGKELANTAETHFEETK